MSAASNQVWVCLVIGSLSANSAVFPSSVFIKVAPSRSVLPCLAAPGAKKIVSLGFTRGLNDSIVALRNGSVRRTAK